ncbi:hypothetical protein AC579_545 [Pseudocercospora musae]|uniref:Uncharacterized protein n=1 Tax=Pseudocercospora musae TaxID=113226 RepID=A0A139IRE0_9PEZI|nr:hypothetical protein AC579_545 [Pseudocercospora musae]
MSPTAEVVGDRLLISVAVLHGLALHCVRGRHYAIVESVARLRVWGGQEESATHAGVERLPLCIGDLVDRR